mgnify:CR=1 FL=1
MPGFLQTLFSTGPFIPHGHCYLWKPGLVWLHVGADAFITAAYYSIPLILVYFLRRRQDLPFSWVFALFSAFIFACGTTHLVNIWTLWHPAYWWSGAIKAGTAGISVFTAIALVPIMPQAIALPSPNQLAQANRALEQEIAERKLAEARIQALNLELERRVQRRTQELEQVNQKLTHERDRYQSLVLATTQVVWHADATGQMLYTLPGSPSLLPPNLADRTSLEWLQLIHPDDQPQVQQAWRTAIANKSCYAMSYRLLAQGDKCQEVQARAVPVLEPDGQVREWIGTLIDVTERNQLERELHLSQVKLNNILSQADAAIISLRLYADHSYEYEYHSIGCARVFGYSKYEFEADKQLWFSRIHPSDRPTIVGPVYTAIFAEQSIQAEYRFQHKNGSWRWIAETFNAYRDETEACWFVTVVATDVTALKQAETALRRSEEQFRLTLNFTNIGTWVWHLATKQATWNPNHFYLLGLDPQDYGPTVDDQIWRDRVHPDDLPQVEAAFAQALAQGHDCEVEYRVVYPNGELHWVIARGHILRDEAGTPTEVLGVLIDVSDRKQAELQIHQLNQALEFQNRNLEILVDQRTTELSRSNSQLQAEIQERYKTEQALQHSEALFRQVFENAPIGITLADPKTLRFVALNPAMCTMLAYEAAELMHLSFFDITHPDDLQQDLQLRHQLFQGQRSSYRLPQRYYRKDQQLLWAELAVCLIVNQRGDGLYVMGLMDDITERKQHQDAIAQRTLQLEAINRELESFSYSVSHDLRAPLRHINGFVNALRNQLTQTEAIHNPKVVHYLNIIATSGQRMSLLIDGLLTLSRAGRRQMERQPVDLGLLVEKAIQLVQDTYDHADRVEFHIGPLPTIRGDEAMLQQVFTNLIDNAVKFSRDRPHPQITIQTIDAHIIQIQDNGIGFPMEFADQLFGAFQRLHPNTDFEGTGIGLAIVQRVMHRHGGTIWADSQPDHGTTFYLQFDHPPEAS